MEIRDPIHGPIAVSEDEGAVLEHPFVQRLRGIRQMGFSHLPFPGAVHTRFLHSVGAMHLAGLAFDAAFHGHPVPPERAADWRQAVRLAALLHDVGHAPFSHCTEFAMPPLERLGLRVYPEAVARERGADRATHEDYTVAIITQSSLTPVLSGVGACTPHHVAALVSRDVHTQDDFYLVDGVDHRQVLSQLISSELDVDRLDYLVRDSYFAGVKYGECDVKWLISHLRVHVGDPAEASPALPGMLPAPPLQEASLALSRRAIYAFDDFMVARYHMFVMVYFHHKSVVFEELLKRYFRSAGPEIDGLIPADVEAYLAVDDVHLDAHLRQSTNRWARYLVERRAWRRALELHGTAQDVDLRGPVEALLAAGVEHFSAQSTGQLSRYAGYGRKRSSAPPIFVIDPFAGSRRPVMPLEEATGIFRRYEDERHIARIYVEPGQEALAREVLGTRR